MSEKDIIVYQSPDGRFKLELNIQDNTVWLSQQQIAELFQVDRSVITKHIKNILESGDLTKERTCAFFAQVQNEGDRTVSRNIEHYNLDMIISIGYRVNSIIATRFRQWARIIKLRFIQQREFVLISERCLRVVFVKFSQFAH